MCIQNFRLVPFLRSWHHIVRKRSPKIIRYTDLGTMGFTMGQFQSEKLETTLIHNRGACRATIHGMAVGHDWAHAHACVLSSLWVSLLSPSSTSKDQYDYTGPAWIIQLHLPMSRSVDQQSQFHQQSSLSLAVLDNIFTGSRGGGHRCLQGANGHR